MKHYFKTIGLVLLLTIFSCSGDDDTLPTPTTIITVNDFSTTIDENPDEPDNNTSLGFIDASINTNGALSYTMTQIMPATITGIAVVSNTGELIFTDASVFDFETNPIITAIVEVAGGGVTETVNVTITVNDVMEIPFVTTWETTLANESITIYTNSSDYFYNYTIDWGDGTIDSSLGGNATHSYATAGVYTVSVSGVFPTFSPANFDVDFPNGSKFKSIESWGDIKWETMEFVFRGLSGFEINATDVPDLRRVTTMRSMFNHTSNIVFNQSINDWDVSNIIGMAGVFTGSDFNEDISNWDVGNVEFMNSMFQDATAFNQDISGWDVVNALDMHRMFNSATSFSQNLSGWNTTNVTSCDFFSTNSGLTTAQLPTLGNCF